LSGAHTQERHAAGNGITYVNGGVIGISEEFFVDVIGMPIGANDSVFSCSHLSTDPEGAKRQGKGAERRSSQG
jgi:hypothetical protein